MVVQVLLVVAALLLALNLWFLSRLVKKIDKIDPMVGKVENIEAQLKTLTDLSTRMLSLEKELAGHKAVFDYVMKSQPGGPKP